MIKYKDFFKRYLQKKIFLIKNIYTHMLKDRNPLEEQVPFRLVGWWIPGHRHIVHIQANTHLQTMPKNSALPLPLVFLL